MLLDAMELVRRIALILDQSEGLMSSEICRMINHWREVRPGGKGWGRAEGQW